MTELSYLLELLLEHKLSKATKDSIKQRIKDIETQARPSNPPATVRPPRTAQSPSTQRILDEMAMEQVDHQTPGMPEVIAQTPAAAAALASRAEAIRIATSGVKEPGRTSPRKF